MDPYFLPNSPLTEQQKKWCRCTLHVGARQSPQCLRHRPLGRTPGCYNPYAVCSKTVGTSFRHCSEWFDFDHIPDEELFAYASMRGIPLSDTPSREELLHAIAAWKSAKY